MRRFYSALVAMVMALPLLAGTHYLPVLQETFSRLTSTTPGGGYYSESYFFTHDDGTNEADNAGWTSKAVYVSERCVKFNAKTKNYGELVSPALNLSSETANIKVLYRVQPWKGDKIYFNVEVEGMPDSRVTIDPSGSNNLFNRGEAPYEAIFTNVPKGSKVKFYASQMVDDSPVLRCFLGDIVVLEEVDDSNAAAGVWSTAYYQRYSDLMGGSEPEKRVIDVTFVGATEPITLVGADALTHYTVTKGSDWDAYKGGRLEISFDPENVGDKEETFKVVSGDLEQSYILRGYCKVYAPVISAASDVKDASFVANWEPMPCVDEIVLTVYTKEEDYLKASNLMFTKYIEGSGNNRAVEIFNGTGEPVSLKGWTMKLEFNGNLTGLVANPFEFPDKVLEPGRTFTIVNGSYKGDDVRDMADALITFAEYGNNNPTTFTGDDAIGLFDPEGNLIDVLGYEMYDCNDLVSNVWGQDVSYYRRSDSYDPHPKFYIEEWVKHEKDYCENFGFHELDEVGTVRNIVERVSLKGDLLSYTVNGLLPETDYYYAVSGVSNGFLVPSSKEMMVRTDKSAGIGGVSDAAAPAWRIENGCLILGSKADVYTAAGVLVGSGSNVELPARGVYVIRTSGVSAKVLY